MARISRITYETASEDIQQVMEHHQARGCHITGNIVAFDSGIHCYQQEKQDGIECRQICSRTA